MEEPWTVSTSGSLGWFCDGGVSGSTLEHLAARIVARQEPLAALMALADGGLELSGRVMQVAQSVVDGVVDAARAIPGVARATDGKKESEDLLPRLRRCERAIRLTAATTSDAGIVATLRATADDLARARVELERRPDVLRLVVGGLRRLPARREKEFYAVVEEPQRFRAIHPNSAFKRRWDVLTSFFAVLCVFAGEAGALARAGIRSTPGVWRVAGDLALDAAEALAPSLASFLRVWFIVDILLSFVTGYVDRRGVLVMSNRRIVLNYLFGCFALDVWCATPYDWQPALPDDACETALTYCPPPHRGLLLATRVLLRRATIVVPRTLAFAKRRGRLRQVLISGPTLAGAALRHFRTLRRSLILRVKWRSAAVLARRALHALLPTRPARLGQTFFSGGKQRTHPVPQLAPDATIPTDPIATTPHDGHHDNDFQEAADAAAVLTNGGVDPACDDDFWAFPRSFHEACAAHLPSVAVCGA